MEELATTLLRDATELEKFLKDKKPSVQIQLGLMLLSSDEIVKKILKDWDKRGKGEFAKAEFRLNLREFGLNASSADADSLFDSWDEDKGGVLDLKELRSALIRVRAEAAKWRDTPDPELERAKDLRRRAEMAMDAAKTAKRADELEAELDELTTKLESKADVRLGALLVRRCIKPSTVVMQWSTSRGDHAGELSKVEFRKAVQQLGLDSKGPHPTTIEDIDAVFDTFDADHGGYLDIEEAKTMLVSLEKAAEEAEHERFHKRQAAQRMRASATRTAKAATTPAPEPSEAVEASADPDSPGSDMHLLSIDALFEPDSPTLPGGGSRLRQDAKAAQKVEQALRKAAVQWRSRELARAWGTWFDLMEERAALRWAVFKLLQPAKRKAWMSWTEFVNARSNALATIREALNHLAYGEEFAAYQLWAEATRRAQRLASRQAAASASAAASSMIAKLELELSTDRADLEDADSARRAKSKPSLEEGMHTQVQVNFFRGGLCAALARFVGSSW